MTCSTVRLSRLYMLSFTLSSDKALASQNKLRTSPGGGGIFASASFPDFLGAEEFKKKKKEERTRFGRLRRRKGKNAATHGMMSTGSGQGGPQRGRATGGLPSAKAPAVEEKERPAASAATQEMKRVETHPLNDAWVLWFRALSAADWTLKHYKKVAVIDSIEKFWSVYNNITNDLNRGSWFLFRKGIVPNFEDPQNENGGTYSFVCKETRVDAWIEASMACIGEYVLQKPEESKRDITGASYKPQPSHAVIKLWNREVQQGVFKKMTPLKHLSSKEFKTYKAHKRDMKRGRAGRHGGRSK